MDPLLTTRRAAELLGMSEEWVRDHAAEFGAIKLGEHRGAPLRFRSERIEAYVDGHELAPPSPSRRRRKPGPRRTVEGVELLPIPKGRL